MNLLLLRLLVLLLVILPGRGFAQQEAIWPRDVATGRVAFAGILPWPATAPSLAQRQALVRRWYLAKLTTAKSVHFTDKTNFAGVPQWPYLDSVSFSPEGANAVDSVYDKVIWRLGYTVKLRATPAGLAYHLSEFEESDMVYDASSRAEALETLLARYSAELAVFNRRLRKALAGW